MLKTQPVGCISAFRKLSGSLARTRLSPIRKLNMPACRFFSISRRVAIPLAAYPILRYAGGLKRADAASIAAHYGSVSVVTFAVASAFLVRQNVSYEGLLTVFLVLLEAPAILIGVMLARGMGG